MREHNGVHPRHHRPFTEWELTLTLGHYYPQSRWYADGLDGYAASVTHLAHRYCQSAQGGLLRSEEHENPSAGMTQEQRREAGATVDSRVDAGAHSQRRRSAVRSPSTG